MPDSQNNFLSTGSILWDRLELVRSRPPNKPWIIARHIWLERLTARANPKIEMEVLKCQLTNEERTEENNSRN